MAGSILYRSRYTFRGHLMTMATILLIDDNDQIRKVFHVALQGRGHRVLIAENAKHALHLLQHELSWTEAVVIKKPVEGL